MTIRPFPVALATVVVGFIAVIIVSKITAPPEPPRPGIEQADHGREHVSSRSMAVTNRLLLARMLIPLHGAFTILKFVTTK